MADSPTTTNLTPDPANANRGTVRGLGMVERSLQQYGAGRSILASKDGIILAGNKTYDRAIELGIPVKEIESDGKTLFVIKRTDLTYDDPRAKELAIADNRASETGLEWDADVLAALADDGVDLSQFWFEDELADLLAADEITEGLTDPDDVPDVPDEPITKPGDLWLLGDKHRILCGDSTVATDVERLLDGATPSLMVTDPPYGVEYDANWRNDAAEKGLIAYGASRVKEVSNDDQVDWREAFALVPADVVYCWSSSLWLTDSRQALESCGYEIRAEVVWAKSSFAISRGHYHWQHEPCWYAVRKGATASWVGDHSQTTLWQIALDKNTDGGHSTQKPVECMARPIRNHSGDVYDPFLGSGTTVIAAEMNGRRCYAMELSPGYVDAAVRRWELFTGETATRAEYAEAVR